MSREDAKPGYQTSILSKSTSSASSCSVIIYFDGVCGLCHRFVNFVIRRDPSHLIRFAPLQGKTFAQLLERSPWLEGTDSLVVTIRVVNREAIYIRSRGVLMVLAELPAPWRWLGVFRVIPAFVMDLGYKLVSKFRYRIFGKKETCRIPTSEEREWFLD